MNKNKKIISAVDDISDARLHGKSNSNAMRTLFSPRFSFKKNQQNKPSIPQRAISMKSYTTKSLVFLFSLLLMGVNANASITWGTPANNTVVNSGENLGNVSASASGGFFEGNPWVDFRSSGGCLFGGTQASRDFDAGWMGTASGSDSVIMNAGALVACTITISTQDDSAQTRKYLIRQILTVNNPGSTDDVDPDYPVYASAKTADGISNTLDATNKFTFSIDPTSSAYCQLISTDVNSVMIRNKTGFTGASGTCKLNVSLPGNANIEPKTGSTSWLVVNTQTPQLALVKPVSQGKKPFFTFTSTQPGPITLSGAGCVGPAQNAVIGLNTYRFNQLTLGAEYTCVVTVTNAVGPGTLNLPTFMVTESIDGPGGVGGTDGTTATKLWLNGNNLPAVNGTTITTWADQSGNGYDFGGGVSPVVGTINNLFKTAAFTTNKYLIRNSVDLSARSLFIVYNDTSTTKSWVAPVSSSVGGLLHGYCDNTRILSDISCPAAPGGPYTDGRTTGGVTYANGALLNIAAADATNDRPSAAKIYSHIFTSAYSGVGNWFIGRDQCCDDRSIEGGIAETIMFSTAINHAQRIILENYLSAKYNIALASNIYTYGGAGAFKFDMAGIGKSSTDGSSHINAKGAQVQINNPVGLGNDEYVMWAHDNAALSFQNTDVPADISQRLNRIWRVRNPGNGVTNMDVSFHISEIPGFLTMCFDPNSVRLLKTTDANFSAMSAANKVTGVYNAKTKVITYTNVVLNDGDYIAFGVGGTPSSVYVTPKGAGTKDGKTWANACTLQAALDAPRVIGDTVKLARGTYKPSSTMYISQGITIQGGFEGVIESEVSDPEANVTVVSGDKDNNDAVLGDIVMYHRDINGTNLSRLFNIVGVPNKVTLDGFHITGMSQYGNHGSAVWQANTTVDYKKMKFFGNRAREMGGAVLVYNGTANISDSIFLGNAGEEGGALNANGAATVNITRSQFINNDSILLNNRFNASSPVSVSRALSFNGSNNQVATDKTKSPTNTFTYEAWVKSDDFAHEIDAQNNTSADGVSGQRYVFGADGGRDGNCASVASGAGLSVGTNGVSVYEHAGCYMPALAVWNAGSNGLGTGWHHIAVVYENRIPRIYVDGVLKVTGVVSGKATVYAPWEIGLGAYAGFSGQIDEVRIWNDVRTLAEIQGNMYREISNPTADASLVGYWKFNDDVLGNTAVTNNGALSAIEPLYVNGTVTDGTATGTGWNRFAGGAIDINSGSTVTVTHSSFIGNNAQNFDYSLGTKGIGGAISLTHNASSDPSKNKSTLTVEDSSFSYNGSRDGGGAIYAMSGFKKLDVKRTTFQYNATTRPVGTAYWGSGGAIYAAGSPTATEGVVNIWDSEFERNSAKELGGALFFSGNYPDADADNYLAVDIKRSSFISNSANFGGGMFTWQFGASTHNSHNVENSTFSGNVANYYGGGLAAVNAADVTINWSTFYANIAGTDGGGVKVRDANGTVVIKNSLLVDNLANAGNGSLNDGTVGKPFTSLEQARWWVLVGGGTAGVYNFNLNGQTFSTQVDASGYVLVATNIGAADATTSLTPVNSIAAFNTTNSILNSTIFANLGNVQEIRITAVDTNNKYGGGATAVFDMKTSNATNIARLKAFQPLYNNFDLGIAANTSGDPWYGTHNARMNGATCTDGNGTAAGVYGLSGSATFKLSHNMLGHCGDGEDFHWQMARTTATANLSTLRYAAATPRDKLNLWVIGGSITQGRGNNIENSVAITATGYNLIGYNNISGWRNTTTENQVPTGNSFTATATTISSIINTVLNTNGGLTRHYSLSSNGGAGSPAFNKIPATATACDGVTGAVDQRGQARVSTGGFSKCDIGAYETIKTDTDGDGVIDAVDKCIAVSDATQSDIDGDDIGDACDPDIDNDGVLNAADYFPTIALGLRLDTDHDGIPDVCADAPDACGAAGMFADPDKDNDAVPNAADNCPVASNTDQNDIDADSTGDACDGDMDGDGINNDEDNCVAVSNPLQTDSDGNGLGNDCNAFFVKTVATGLADGSSWNNAYGAGSGAQLQNAIDAAFAKSASLIYMAEGIYRPSAKVNLKAGLQIYGGFTGINETYHYESDPEANPTIISADTNADDVKDAYGVTQSYANQVGSNITTIFDATSQGTGAGLVISLTGITLTGASDSAVHVKDSRMRIKNVKFLGNKGLKGGGLFVEQNSYVIVMDSSFASNQSSDGGAVHVAGIAGASGVSEATFVNTDFSNNRSTLAGVGVGGALSLLTNTQVTLSSCTLTDNQSVTSGGAIHANTFDTLYITGSTFSGNHTSTTSFGLGGGAIRLMGVFSSLYIGTTDFLGNYSASEGGALMVSSTGDIGGGVAKQVTIEDTLFKSNSTSGANTLGGAISVGNSIGLTALTVSRSSFVSNASVNGGAIYLSGGDGNDMALDNSTFYDNRSSGYGGAIALNNSADATLVHATLFQNIATGNGGGVRVQIDAAGSTLSLKNSLVIDNTGSNGMNISNAGTFTDQGYNIIGYGAGSGLYTGGTNNVVPSGTGSKKAVATSVDAIIKTTLADYSGLHKSIALTKTSEARDVIAPGVNGCPIVSATVSPIYDERGFERPDMVDVTDPEQTADLGKRKCDVGAFEFNNAYRVDCFDEDGLRPDQGTGWGYYYCEDGTKPSAAELANNVFVGRIDYYVLLLMFMTGLVRLSVRQKK